MPKFLLFALIVFHRVVKTNHHLTGIANLFSQHTEKIFSGSDKWMSQGLAVHELGPCAFQGLGVTSC